MKTITALMLLFCSQLFTGQKLENFKQSIESEGTFAISTYSENYYAEVIKNSIPLLDPIKNKDKTDFDKLKKLFPDFLEGNCLKLDEEVFKPKKFKICAANTAEKSDSTSIQVDGKLILDSKLDEFYIFKYYFMEMGGYYLLNSKTQKIYQVFHLPKFSEDKSYIVVPYVDYHRFNLQIIDISTNRRLSYYLGDGKFSLNKIELANINSFRKKVLFLDLTQKIIYDEDYQTVDEKIRSIKLLIQ